LFFSFPAQRSRAARSDEMEKNLQDIESKEEKKYSTFVTEKRDVSFLKKGGCWQLRNLCRNGWSEA
jgi:hypothetical protein